jgi:hypothetical protein
MVKNLFENYSWFSTYVYISADEIIIIIIIIIIIGGERGGVVVKALRYKPAGRGFDSRWCHWNFSYNPS